MSRFLGLAIIVTFGFATAAQEPGIFPAIAIKPIAESPQKPRDLSKLTPLDRHLYLTAVRGMDWLQRSNQPDGKFLAGFLPALAAKAEGDPFMPQVEATIALVRGARFFQDEKALALGKQALLRVLQETMTDQAQPPIRFTSAPEPFVNRLAAAGLILRAIHELPNPPADLVEQGEQLARYLRSQIQADGTFIVTAEEPAIRRHVMQTCIGPALAGLALSCRGEADAWKVDAVRKASGAYLAAWRQDKNPLMIPEHTAAFTAALLKTRDAALAQAIFEMNDWLLTQQQPRDPRRPHASGGFAPWRDGRLTTLPADAGTSAYAASLADACRAARFAGDSARLERYRTALEAALQFVATLQYTDAHVQHFAEWYRPWVTGGFFNHSQDGNLQLISTAHAVTALTAYLENVANLPK